MLLIEKRIITKQNTIIPSYIILKLKSQEQREILKNKF